MAASHHLQAPKAARSSDFLVHFLPKRNSSLGAKWKRSISSIGANVWCWSFTNTMHARFWEHGWLESQIKSLKQDSSKLMPASLIGR